MTIQHEQEYQLRTGDFDRRAELKPSAVLDIFQDIAGVSAEQTPGMSAADMREAGLFWAVVQIKYEVLKTPALHERVIASTWPLAPTRMGFQREYAIRGLDGEPLVKGDSQWIMMDRATRKFASAKDAYHGPMDFSDERNFAKKTRRIRDFEPDAPASPYPVTCGYCDIDVNGHVNNTKYADFFLDAWDPSADEHIRTFQIDYRHEIREGEQVGIVVQRGDAEVLAKGVGPDGEARFFCRAELAG